MSLTKPSAVIFDWDNTLVDTWPVIHEALHNTMVGMGKEPWTLDEVKARVRKSMRDSFPEVFGERWQEAGDLYQQQYRSLHLGRLGALEGAEAMLRELKQLGIPSLIVSNKKGDTLRKEVDHLGWNDLFVSVVGSTDAARDKPFPDPVELALAKIGRKAEAGVWFVGDSDIDLDCAARTGCTAILYGDYAAQNEAFTKTDYFGFPYAHFVVDHDALTGLFKK